MPLKEQQVRKQMYDFLFGDTGSVTLSEFTKAFEAIIEQILKFEKKLQDKNTSNAEELRRLFAIYKYELNKGNETEIKELRRQIATTLDRALLQIQTRLASIKDGKEGPPGPQGIAGEPGIQGIQGIKGEDGSPDTGEDIITKVNKDKGSKKIKKEKVEGLEHIIDWIKDFNGNERRMRLYNGGLVSEIVAGSNVTVDSTDPGRPIISASGAALAIITVTGTINDTNTSFTAASTPTLVCINGAFYRNGKGVTISGTSITTDNPVGTAGDIYCL
jgi:hypothetical protein